MCISVVAVASRASGAMDNASDYGSEDSRFDSWLARCVHWATTAELLAASGAMVLAQVFCASSPKANALQPFSNKDLRLRVHATSHSSSDNATENSSLSFETAVMK